MVTKPFSFEGRRRMTVADRAVDELRTAVDTLITIPNERLLNFVERGTPLSRRFASPTTCCARRSRGSAT